MSTLLADPLVALTTTLFAYLAGHTLYEWSNRFVLFQPILLGALMIAALIWLAGVPFPEYFEAAGVLHFLLGPATVALAVPLYREFHRIRRFVLPGMLALLVGGVGSILIALALVLPLGLHGAPLMSLLPKSVTTPIAMGVSELLGGYPPLTAGLVVLTGIVGAITANPVCRLLHVTDERARGIALGITAHGVGTAHAFESGQTAGAFASLGMGLCGMLTAALLPQIAGHL